MTISAENKKNYLPSDWRFIKLGHLLDIADSGIWGIEDQVNGVSILRSTNFNNDGSLDFTNLTLRDISESDRRLKLLSPGDILLERSGGGPKQPVGRVCFFSDFSKKYYFNNFCQRFRVINSECFPKYLFWYLYFFHLSGQTLSYQTQTIGIRNLEYKNYIQQLIPLPLLNEQKRISAILDKKMDAVNKALEAAKAQIEVAIKLQYSYIQDTLKSQLKAYSVSECTEEVSTGIGSTWISYPLLGVTRSGLAPAKEPVGSRPERYKLADVGTIFYNPMRILIGSIALVDDGDSAGITSPDYVVIKAKEGILHYRWFYYWLRSSHGERFIKSLARGAVRERILYNRLIQGSIELPSYESQLIAAEKIAKIKPLIMGIEEQLKYINALPATILRKAFSGGF